MLMANVREKVKIGKNEIVRDVKESTKILTVPTFLNVSRIILTFVIVYMIIIDSNIIKIVFVFVIAALTDWFDGYIARKYNLANEFGRKADMFADRVLWIGTALAFIFVFGIRGRLEAVHGWQILLIMSREIISAPFAIVGAFSGVVFPHARYVAKITTFLQGFALPAVILSVYYQQWTYFSLPLSIVIGGLGIVSGLHYIKDIQAMKVGTYKLPNKRKNRN